MHLGIIASSKASYIKSLRRCSQKRWRLFEECSWNDSWVLPVCGGGGFWWMAANVALWQQTPARLQRESHPSFFYFSSWTPAASKAGRKGSYRFRSSNKTAASESREQNHSWARHTSGKQWWLFSLWVRCVHNLKRDWLILRIRDCITESNTHDGFLYVVQSVRGKKSWRKLRYQSKSSLCDGNNHKPANHR